MILRDEYLAVGYSEVEVAEFDSESTIAEIEAALNRSVPWWIGSGAANVSGSPAGSR